MMQHKKLHYKHTIYASYIGYATQAIVNNFVPLLFLRFSSDFGLSLKQITWITTLNFAVQLLVDLLSAKLIDKIGYRISIVFAHFSATVGFIGLAVFPKLIGNDYAGILLSVIFYAIGGGIIEVLLSPIVEACPTDKKEAIMSLLHSFYCWGQLAVVLLSTGFFAAFGIENWRILACLWALVPFFNLLYFLAVPLFPIVEDKEKIPFRNMLKQKVFWLLIMVMLCAGASELAMSQWASSFAESALHVSKSVGDLAGPCAFALFMGLARVLYGKFSEKLPLKNVMILSAVFCAVCYGVTAFVNEPMIALVGCALCGFFVGIFWPGTFSIAAWNLKSGGTAMYAMMALAGDVGCSLGPTVVGLTASASHGNLQTGLGVAMLFPVLMCLLLPLLKGKKQIA